MDVRGEYFDYVLQVLCCCVFQSEVIRVVVELFEFVNCKQFMFWIFFFLFFEGDNDCLIGQGVVSMGIQGQFISIKYIVKVFNNFVFISVCFINEYV